MSAYTHKGESMKLSSFLVDTTDHGSVMLAKVAPAAGLVGASELEVAKAHLVPYLEMPWGDFCRYVGRNMDGAVDRGMALEKSRGDH